MRSVIKSSAGSILVLALLCCRSAPNVYRPDAQPILETSRGILEPSRVVVYYSRAGVNGFRIAEIGIDDIGCSPAAIDMARNVAADRGGNAVVVRCFDTHGRELAWSNPEVQRGSTLGVTVMKVSTWWDRPAN